MEIYLVGGAVRDRLLGKPVQDRDWVVVGSSPEEMLAKGFKQVGADFPVFLHPQTREEYALARTERKQGHGYHGFTIYSSPDVSLEEDLQRRDLTINAMAESEAGEVIDPFGGRRDLEQKTLRHVSPAFAEDPLRILRLARFSARLAPLGFEVAQDTRKLMQKMVAAGEVEHLVPERIWQETRRALHENRPRKYFEVLRECDALAVVMPEIDALFGTPEAPEHLPLPAHYPSLDTGEQALECLNRACLASNETAVRFAALTHKLGKPLTPKAEWPCHKGHEEPGRKVLDRLCKRLKVPNDCRELALMATRLYTKAHDTHSLNPEALLALMDSLDAWRRPERYELFLQVCEADAKAWPGLEAHAYTQADLLRRALAAAQSVQAKQFLDQGLTGKELGFAIRQGRLERIRQASQYGDLGLSDEV